MTNELEVLKSVELEDKITQRELARRTGLSLGAVNVLIKRLIHKGLLKIEHINTRTLRYILTPKGMMEKARLTYKYIVASYNHISNIENKLENIINNKYKQEKILLYGQKDELYEIIVSKLHAMNIPYKFIDDLDKHKMYNNECIIITWDPDKIVNYAEQKNIINIFNEI